MGGDRVRRRRADPAADGRAAPACALSVRRRDRPRRLPGQAGLPTLRLECGLRAAAPVDSRHDPVRLRRHGAGRRGRLAGDHRPRRRRRRWPAPTCPAAAASARLTAYPQDLLASPLDVRSLTAVGATRRRRGWRRTPPAADPAGDLVRGADRLTLAFEGLLTPHRGQPVARRRGAAGGAGARRRARGRARATGRRSWRSTCPDAGRARCASAATVGATVTVTHTAGVLPLGLLVSAGHGVRAGPGLPVAQRRQRPARGARRARRCCVSPPAAGHSHPAGTAPTTTTACAGTPHRHGDCPAARRTARPGVRGSGGRGAPARRRTRSTSPGPARPRPRAPARPRARARPPAPHAMRPVAAARAAGWSRSGWPAACCPARRRCWCCWARSRSGTRGSASAGRRLRPGHGVDARRRRAARDAAARAGRAAAGQPPGVPAGAGAAAGPGGHRRGGRRAGRRPLAWPRRRVTTGLR